MSKKRTKTGQLLKVAYSTYRSGEADIAKDLFVLAMEDPSAPLELGGQDVGTDELAKQLQDDVAKGDFDAAKQKLAALESMAEEPKPSEPGEPSEGALSPGDSVAPPPSPELAPAQVASLVTLARKVKASGHPDLSQKIVKALGL